MEYIGQCDLSDPGWAFKINLSRMLYVRTFEDCCLEAVSLHSQIGRALIFEASTDMDEDPADFKVTPEDFEALIADPGIGLTLGFQPPVYDSPLNENPVNEVGMRYFSALDGEAGSPASPTFLGGQETPITSMSRHFKLPSDPGISPFYSGVTNLIGGVPPFTNASALSLCENTGDVAIVETGNDDGLLTSFLNEAGQRSPLTLPTAALLPYDLLKPRDDPLTTSLARAGSSIEKVPMESEKKREFDPASISFLFDTISVDSSKTECPSSSYCAPPPLSIEKKVDSKFAKKPNTAGRGKIRKAGTAQLELLDPCGKSVVQTTKKEREPMKSSRHCHICARSGLRANLASCKNLGRVTDSCRKAVCRKCFRALGIEGTFENATRPGLEWECLHCRLPAGGGKPGGRCPAHAQCKIYAKTNARRRTENLKKKRLRGATEGSEGVRKLQQAVKVRSMGSGGEKKSAQTGPSTAPANGNIVMSKFGGNSVKSDTSTLPAGMYMSW